MVGAGGVSASLSGLRPTRSDGLYSAARAGVLALAQSAALELAPAVRRPAPGMTRTPIREIVVANDEWPAAAEPGPPVGSARPTRWPRRSRSWPSNAASYVTGQTVVVDGGSLLPRLQSGALLRAISGGAP